MAIDVTVVSVSTEGIDELAVQIGRIGNNVNQIARLYNTEHNLNDKDVKRLLEYMKKLVAVGNKFYDDIFTLKSKSKIGI